MQYTSDMNATAQDYQEYFHISDQTNVSSNQVYCDLIDPSYSKTGYMDLTGRSPKRSSRVNECILVEYHCDANCVEGIPTKNRKGPTIAAAWKLLHNTLKKSGVAPQAFVLDN